MKKIRNVLIVLSMLFCSVTFAEAQVSIGIGLPNLSIGINLPVYPELAPVPGYPVYYAPQVNGNYFFYDGMYWVYQNDNWYASTWYNGPWGFVEPYAVPLYVLRIPVRYYRQPPVYFRGWQSNAPPRWGQHWGRDWEQRRGGWDRWNKASVPARAPRPTYQRQYTGDRYPSRVEQQQKLRSQSYRYQPRDTVVRQHIQQQAGQKAPAPAQRGRQEAPPVKNQRQAEPQRSAPPQQHAPAVQDRRQQPAAVQHQQQPAAVQRQQQPAAVQRQQQPAAVQHQQQPAAVQHQQQPAAVQHQQQAPRPQVQEQRQQRGEPQDSNQGRGQGQNKDDDRGRGRDR
jgi:hypothetical protein